MAEDRPNILLLLTDQQRYDAAGCNGARVVRTPAIDGIARRGMRFTSAYTPIALCSPARGCLMTGLYAHNHGQLANMGNFNGVFNTQVLEKPAFPRLLRAAGYQTGYAGKWHLPKEGVTEAWGFDRWHTTGDWHRQLKAAGIEFDYGRDDVQRMEWGRGAPFCGRTVLPPERTHDAWVADRAVEMIGAFAKAKAPFMVCASFFGPHFPYAVPAPHDTMYDPARVERWDNFDETFETKPLIQQKESLRWNASQLTWTDWQNVIAHYWGACTFIDDQIGRVLSALDQSGRAGATLVILATDHGDMLGCHRLFNKGFHGYEETHHIPLVVSGPPVSKPGSVCDEFVNLVDLMPTVLDAAGVAQPQKVDGRSMLPLLGGRRPDDWPQEAFSEFHGYESTLYSMRMVRNRRWKYVYNPATEDELYDVVSDPGELRNLAGKLAYKHVLRRMRADLLGWLRRTNDGIADEGTWQSNSYDLYVSGREA